VKNEFPMLPSLDELTAACGEKILNPDFLLHGGGVPFTTEPVEDEDEKSTTTTNGVTEKGKESSKIETINSSVKSPKIEEKVLSPIQKDLASPQSIASPQLASPACKSDEGSLLKSSEEDQSNDTNNNGKAEAFDDFDSPKRPIITLKSRKMKGLKDLLLAEKLNNNAISLQITAQSHIGNKKSRSSLSNEETIADGSRPKRTRRE
jgi:menin